MKWIQFSLDHLHKRKPTIKYGTGTRKDTSLKVHYIKLFFLSEVLKYLTQIQIRRKFERDFEKKLSLFFIIDTNVHVPKLKYCQENLSKLKKRERVMFPSTLKKATLCLNK